MKLQHILALIFIFFAWSNAFADDNPTPKPYILEGTEVQNISSKILKRDYEIFISLPDSYATSNKLYPVMFITDSNYAFPLIRSISRRVSDKGKNLQEFILIGLSYSKGDAPVYSRNRDYTPTDINAKNTKVNEKAEGEYGQAEQYRKFIAEEVFPFIEKHYRTDMNRKIYAGHSYGGLFGAHILFNEPTMFNYYILSSPSLWFDNHSILEAERQYADTNKDLAAKVFILIGSFEEVKLGVPRYHQDNDMVRDIKNFEKILKARNYPNLSIHYEIIHDEDHLTVFPSSITRGLTWALRK
jgi:predicted alpha/beta superfamily hydrolase